MSDVERGAESVLRSVGGKNPYDDSDELKDWSKARRRDIEDAELESDVVAELLGETTGNSVMPESIDPLVQRGKIYVARGSVKMIPVTMFAVLFWAGLAFWLRESAPWLIYVSGGFILLGIIQLIHYFIVPVVKMNSQGISVMRASFSFSRKFWAWDEIARITASDPTGFLGAVVRNTNSVTESIDNSFKEFNKKLSPEDIDEEPKGNGRWDKLSSQLTITVYGKDGRSENIALSQVSNKEAFIMALVARCPTLCDWTR